MGKAFLATLRKYFALVKPQRCFTGNPRICLVLPLFSIRRIINKRKRIYSVQLSMFVKYKENRTKQRRVLLCYCKKFNNKIHTIAEIVVKYLAVYGFCHVKGYVS